MRGRGLQVLEDDFCSIFLQILGICNYLHDTVPDFIPDMITSSADELQDRIDIPFV